MYGNQHLLLSLLTVSFITMPLLIFIGDLTLIVIPLAAGFGSLIPDVDASDAAIKHTKIRGTSRFVGRRYARIINNFFGAMQWVFGLIAEYLIYKPYCFLLKEKASHRGIYHSLYAALLTAAVFGLIVSLFMLYLKSFSLPFVSFITLGVFLGFALHLLEDACTVEGVDFLAPFQSFHLQGDHKTMGDKQMLPNAQIFILLTLNFVPHALWFLSQPSFGILPEISPYVQVPAAIVVAVVIWAIFLKLHNIRKKTAI